MCVILGEDFSSSLWASSLVETPAGKKGNATNISEENFEKNILYNLQMLYFYITLTKLSDAHTCHCVHIKQPKAKEIKRIKIIINL